MVSINKVILGASASAAIALGVRAVARLKSRTGRWKSVTVLAPAERLRVDGVYPGPLAILGEAVDVVLTEAPAGQGTVLTARVAPGASDRVRTISGMRPDDAVRAALRDAKSLVESGQVMRIDPRPHGERPGTLPGKLVDSMDTTKGKGIL